jgi:hypothetical protein
MPMGLQNLMIPTVRRCDGDADHQSWNHAYHQPVSGTILVSWIEDWISEEVGVQDVFRANSYGPTPIIFRKVLHQMHPVAIINLERVFGVKQVNIKPFALAWTFWHAGQLTTWRPARVRSCTFMCYSVTHGCPIGDAGGCR